MPWIDMSQTPTLDFPTETEGLVAGLDQPTPILDFLTETEMGTIGVLTPHPAEKWLPVTAATTEVVFLWGTPL